MPAYHIREVYIYSIHYHLRIFFSFYKQSFIFLYKKLEPYHFNRKSVDSVFSFSEAVPERVLPSVSRRPKKVSHGILKFSPISGFKNTDIS